MRISKVFSILVISLSVLWDQRLYLQQIDIVPKSKGMQVAWGGGTMVRSSTMAGTAGIVVDGIMDGIMVDIIMVDIMVTSWWRTSWWWDIMVARTSLK